MSGVSLLIDGYSSRATEVNNRGQLSTISETVSSGLAAAIRKNRYNISTPTHPVLTDDEETPILYVKNIEPEDPGWALTAISIVVGVSAGGSGDWSIVFYSNPNEGTIISSGADAVIQSQNLGSLKPLGIVAKAGETGLTLDGSNKVLSLVPIAPAGINQQIDAIVMPPGTSFGVSIIPPTGNTSIKVDVISSIIRLE